MSTSGIHDFNTKQHPLSLPWQLHLHWLANDAPPNLPSPPTAAFSAREPQAQAHLNKLFWNSQGYMHPLLLCLLWKRKTLLQRTPLQWIGRAWLTTLSITIESGRSNKPTAWEICSCVLGHIHTQILSLIVILCFSFKEGHLGFCKMTTYDENNVPGKASYPCSGAIFPAWHCPFKIENINRFEFQIFIVKWFYFLNDLFQISKGDLYLTFSISSSEISLILLIYTFRTQRMWQQSLLCGPQA